MTLGSGETENAPIGPIGWKLNPKADLKWGGLYLYSDFFKAFLSSKIYIYIYNNWCAGICKLYLISLITL